MESMESAEVKQYEFRRLNSMDVFLMFKIISKIGINEFTKCFETDAIKKLLTKFKAPKVKESEDSETTEETVAGAEAKTTEDLENTEEREEDGGIIVGIGIGLEVANTIMTNLPRCEVEVYQMLANVSGKTVNEIKNQDSIIFVEMIIDFIKKEEFKDFIKVVSRLFK